MKQQSLHVLIIRLRICIVAALLTFLCLFLFSFKVNMPGAEFWKQLGITQSKGTENISNSFIGGYFNYYGAASAKNILAGNRTAVAKDLLGYAKEYISSDTFKKEYERNRQDMKPHVPEKKTARTKEVIRKETIAENEKNLKDLQERTKAMTPDMQKMMQPTIEAYQKQLKDYKAPNNKQFEMMAQYEQTQIDWDQKNYEEKLKKWEAEYAADPKSMIKERLQKYLDLSATVDFNAELTEKYKKKVFVNDQYERKPAEWKMIFRAGKDVCEIARGFAQQWLKELK